MQSTPIAMPARARPRRGDACLRATTPNTMATMPAIIAAEDGSCYGKDERSDGKAGIAGAGLGGSFCRARVVLIKSVVDALLDIFLGHACLPYILLAHCVQTMPQSIARGHGIIVVRAAAPYACVDKLG